MLRLIMPCLCLLMFHFGLLAQISEIKKKSQQNKSNRVRDNITFNMDAPAQSPERYHYEQGVIGCSDLGCFGTFGFIADYTRTLYNMRDIDPSLVSVDVSGGFSPALHFTSDGNFKYLNFLPQIRLHLASFMFDFRYNMLTEFTNDLPNSFKSWELLGGINIIPSTNYKLALGIGWQKEEYSDLFFTQYFIGNRIGIFQNVDYLDIDMRFSFDNLTLEFPFFEAGIKYNYRLLKIPKFYAHIIFGFMYQNYYQSHDIWGIRTGMVVNFHQ
jgi:hypothetical protein